MDPVPIENEKLSNEFSENFFPSVEELFANLALPDGGFEGHLPIRAKLLRDELNDKFFIALSKSGLPRYLIVDPSQESGSDFLGLPFALFSIKDALSDERRFTGERLIGQFSTEDVVEAKKQKYIFKRSIGIENFNLLSIELFDEFKKKLEINSPQIWESLRWSLILGVDPNLHLHHITSTNCYATEEIREQKIANIFTQFNDLKLDPIKRAEAIHMFIKNGATYLDEGNLSAQKVLALYKAIEGFSEEKGGNSAQLLSVLDTFENIIHRSAAQEILVEGLFGVNHTSVHLLSQLDLAVSMLLKTSDENLKTPLIDLIRDVVSKDPAFLSHLIIKRLGEYSNNIDRLISENHLEDARELATQLSSEAEILASCNIRVAEFTRQDYALTSVIDSGISTMKDYAYSILFPELHNKVSKIIQMRDLNPIVTNYSSAAIACNVGNLFEKLNNRKKVDLKVDEVSGEFVINEGGWALYPIGAAPLVGHEGCELAIVSHKHIGRLMELFAMQLLGDGSSHGLAQLETSIGDVNEEELNNFLFSRHDLNKSRVYLKSAGEVSQLVQKWVASAGKDPDITLDKIYIREQKFNMQEIGDVNRIALQKTSKDLETGEIIRLLELNEADINRSSRAVHLHFSISVTNQVYPVKFEIQIATEELRRDNLLMEALYHSKIIADIEPDGDSILI